MRVFWHPSPPSFRECKRRETFLSVGIVEWFILFGGKWWEGLVFRKSILLYVSRGSISSSCPLSIKETWKGMKCARNGRVFIQHSQTLYELFTFKIGHFFDFFFWNTKFGRKIYELLQSVNRFFILLLFNKINFCSFLDLDVKHLWKDLQSYTDYNP